MFHPFDFPAQIGSFPCLILGAGWQHGLTGFDTTYQQHSHTNFELHYVREGACSIIADGKLHQVYAGHALLLPPGTYHHIFRLTEDIEKLDISFLTGANFTGAPKSEEFSRIRSAFSIGSILDFELQDPGCSRLKLSLDYLSDVFLKGEELSFLRREQFRTMSSVFLIELYSALSKSTATELQNTDSTSESRAWAMDSFFAHSFRDPDPCCSLAKLLNVSQRQVSRIVRQQYHMSLREKINETRLQNSLVLLTDSDKSISDIAEEMGYASPSNFSIFIREQTGLSPSEIRKQKNPPGKLQESVQISAGNEPDCTDGRF